MQGVKYSSQENIIFMLYILQIFLYYFIQGLKTLTTTQRNRSPRQRDFFYA